MNKHLRYFLPILVVLLLFAVHFSGCDKEKTDKNSELVSFSGLVAERDTMLIGSSIFISAEYEGKGVSFEWEASSGNLFGGGAQVEYHVSFCDIGTNTITCKASAANNTITRTINIVVDVE